MERQRFELDFREALSCDLGPLKLSSALAKILPQIKRQRDLGASWQQISDCLSAVLETESRPRVNAATLRGIVRRIAARDQISGRPVPIAKAPRTSRALVSDPSRLVSLPDLPADAATDLATRLQALRALS